jgi:hypothetical protein
MRLFLTEADRRALFSRLIPVILLALLLMVTFAGSIWHAHAAGDEANCSVCHLSHQPIVEPSAPAQLLALEPLRDNWVVEEPAAPPAPAILRAASRAPPSL